MKVFFFVAMLWFCDCGYSQTLPAYDINNEGIVGQCAAGTDVIARLTFKVNNQDTVYTFAMRNKANNEFSSVFFSGGKTVVNRFYTVIKQLISRRDRKHRDYTATITLSDKLVVLATSRILGNTSVIIYLPLGSNSFTKWQVDKLFGKA